MEEAAKLLALLATLEPAAITLVKSFLEKLQGKSVEQITGEADVIWGEVIANAKKEGAQS